MQGRNFIVLAIALAVGLFAVIVANAWFSGVDTRDQQAAQDHRLTRIVVAAQPLEFGAALGTQNIRLQDWPEASVPAGAFRSIDEALKGNRVALRPIVPGEPVLASKVSGGRATLAELLPEGMRAVSVPVNASTGVAGFVLPGTVVDVILTRAIPGDGATPEDMRSDVILHNAQVLAIDQGTDATNDKPQIAENATLAVTLSEAQRLAVAGRIGTLSLALRKVEDSGEALASAVGTVTNRQLGGPRLLIPGRPEPRQNMAVPAASVSGPISPGYSGPKMTVIRGTEPTDYPVGRLGG